MLEKLLLKIKAEPMVALTVAVVVALTAVKVAGGMPLGEVFTEEYLDYVFVAATGLIGRFLVFAPESVRRVVEEALDAGPYPPEPVGEALATEEDPE